MASDSNTESVWNLVTPPASDLPRDHVSLRLYGLTSREERHQECGPRSHHGVQQDWQRRLLQSCAVLEMRRRRSQPRRIHLSARR